MKVHVYFRQKKGPKTVSKEIELAAVPYPGSFFEYEEGWALAEVGGLLSSHITKDGVSISGYGPQFTQEELYSLEELGWEIS